MPYAWCVVRFVNKSHIILPLRMFIFCFASLLHIALKNYNKVANDYAGFSTHLEKVFVNIHNKSGSNILGIHLYEYFILANFHLHKTASVSW